MATLSSDTVPLTWNEALSGIFGSISLAAWVFLLVPQVYTNYKSQSAAGISLPFLLIWFAGDIFNLAGGLWAQLVPTVIALAIYFCASDITLVLQTCYYNYYINGKRKSSVAIQREQPSAVASSQSIRNNRDEEEEFDGDEDEPLLSRSQSNGRRSSQPKHNYHTSDPVEQTNHNRRRSNLSNSSALAGVPENGLLDAISLGIDPKSKTARILRSSLKNAAALVGICVVGTLGWLIAYNTGVWKPVPPPIAIVPGKDGERHHDSPIGAQILGYISAVLYLGARIPQIVKNWREKSCEGLALLFFLLSLTGNLTYGAGILFHSLERQYVITNIPWLIGSLGTMVEDITIFIQFHIYVDKGAELKESVNANGLDGQTQGNSDSR